MQLTDMICKIKHSEYGDCSPSEIILVRECCFEMVKSLSLEAMF